MEAEDISEVSGTEVNYVTEMTLPCSKVIKMAAFKRNLNYLLTNFTSSYFNELSNFQKTRRVLFHCSKLLCVKGREIKMPSLSPTMTEGKIVKWLKKEGDPIVPGDVLCDIETDKAIVSMELEEEGVLGKILVPENTANIKIGTLIALMVGEDEDWKSVEIPDGVSTSSSEPSSSESSASTGESISDGEPIISGASAMPIKMPSLSPTMTEGTIVKWLKKEGDPISPGDVLCDIQTDKAVLSLETEEEGVLAKILAPDDSKNVKVGTLIAVIVPEGEDWKSVVVTFQSSTSTLEKKDARPSQISSVGTTGTGEVGRKKFGPAVRALISLYQLEPGLIKPSGRGNTLLKEDVLKYIADNSLEKKPPKAVSTPSTSKTDLKKSESTKKEPLRNPPICKPEYTTIQLNNSKLLLAKRSVQCKLEVPHFYSTAKCNVDNLLTVKKALLDEGIKVTLNDLLIKAVAFALQMYPKANSFYINNTVMLAQNIDVAVVVATGEGDSTPVIKSANQKSVVNISKEVKELSEKAREGKLKPEENEGATFTISNLGMYGIDHCTAIIHAPQSGVLAVGRTTESLDLNLKIVRHITMCLSSDRRVLENHEAIEFMEVLKYFIENPKLLTSDIKISHGVGL